MKTTELLIRSLRRTMARHTMISALLVLLVFATVAVAWAAGSATQGTSRTIADSIGSKQIEVIQGYGGPQSPNLDSKAIATFTDLAYVENVFPSGSTGVGAPETGNADDAGQPPWWLMPQDPIDDRMKDAAGKPVPVVGAGEMIVPSDLQRYVDQTIEVTATKATSTTGGVGVPEKFTVVGSYSPDSIQGEAPGAVFIQAKRFEEIKVRADPPGAPLYSSVYLYVDDVDNVAAVQGEVEKLGFGARSAIGSGVQLDQAKQGLALTSALLAVITIIGALFAGATVSGAWMTARVEEIGLFRSLGWTRKRIVGLYLLEAVAYALGVAVIGIVLGAVLIGILALLPGILANSLGIQLDRASILSQAWVLLIPLLFVPLGFAVGTVRRSATLLHADADTLLRQL